ncbi:MAG: HPr family phosphocarrier protein [Lachnospiraceae bacterium]|nr:HPr family phosphocarrier protein [Lachnospiraceae bacterium]
MVISLNNIEKVKNFVNKISKVDANVDLESGRYVVDAKSIMGIFSLDLKKPITVKVLRGDEQLVRDTIREFLCNETVNVGVA